MMPGRDTKTRFTGVYARHQQGCRISLDSTLPVKACNCVPSYYGAVYDKQTGKVLRTERYPRVAEARTAREDLVAAVRKGLHRRPTTPMSIAQARTDFVRAAEDGVALNKHGRRYRPKAVKDLRTSLNRVPDWLEAKQLADATRGHWQKLVDDLNEEGLSGSRIRSVLNAARSMYRWAQDREHVHHNPAELVRLPAMESQERDRVATPAEFTRLLDQIKPEWTVVFALAGYSGARHQEIQVIDWEHVSFDLDAIELAGDPAGRKPGGSHRIVPMVKPLRRILRERWLAQGRPTAGKVCPPARAGSESGQLDLSNVMKRSATRWEKAGLEPIGLHESRHTFATWLDHAHVSPKVASVIMGHKTPEYQAGAARITLERYTHVLPDELERAREQVDRFLTERAADTSRGREAAGG